jgi:uroporphyrinogen-III synthase
MRRPGILVIRSDDKFSALVREAGFEVTNLELIKTVPLDDLSELRDKLANLSAYDGLFFTSPVAAEIFVRERNRSNGFRGEAYMLGHRAKNILKHSGIKVRFSESANTAEDLLSSFDVSEFAGKKFLFVRGEKGLRTVPEFLSGWAVVDEVVVYKTEACDVERDIIDSLKTRLSANETGWVCFMSPSGVERFSELFGDVAKLIRAAVIGTTTADAAKQFGFNIDFISARSNTEYFARGLIKHIKNIE